MTKPSVLLCKMMVDINDDGLLYIPYFRFLRKEPCVSSSKREGNGSKLAKRLTESSVELVHTQVSVIVVVIVSQQILHSALHQTLLQVLLH